MNLPEVISKAALPAPYDRDQAEVVQLLVLVDRPVFTLQDDRHVKLLDDEVDHLSGRGRGRDLDAHAGAVRETGVVCRVDLQDVGLRGTDLRRVVVLVGVGRVGGVGVCVAST